MIVLYRETIRGAKQGGWGVATLPEFWMGGGGGVEHLSTPPDLRRFLLGGGGVGSP